MSTCCLVSDLEQELCNIIMIIRTQPWLHVTKIQLKLSAYRLRAPNVDAVEPVPFAQCVTGSFQKWPD